MKNDFTLLADPNAIVVAGSDDKQTGKFSDDRRAEYSSKGNKERYPTVTATGNYDFGFDTHYGTSFSTPLVAGTIARMLELNPSLGFDDIVKILEQSSIKPPDYNREDYGFGVLKPPKAIKLAQTYKK